MDSREDKTMKRCQTVVQIDHGASMPLFNVHLFSMQSDTMPVASPAPLPACIITLPCPDSLLFPGRVIKPCQEAHGFWE